MALETFVNAKTLSDPSVSATTLAGAINASTTTVEVASAAYLPASGQFRALVDDELILVTALVGTTATVTRGIEGTAAATHSSGRGVFHVLTAAAFSRNPRAMTTLGDIEYLDAAGAPARRGIGSTGDVLTVAAGIPAWAAPAAPDLSGYVPTSRTVNGHALSANVTVSASDVSLGNVENTALSTWAGSANLTTLGTIGTGTWNAAAIADAKIASALTGKTYNALTLTAQSTGFTVAGGTTSKTLTVGLDASVSGTNTGDQDLSGYVPTTRAVNGHALSADVTVTKSDLSLGNVENTALSTWAGSTNLTTLGTIGTGTWGATAIAANKGGTGQTGYTTGDLLQASGASALSALAAVVTGNALISGGVGTVGAWGKIGLTTHVSGILPVANGGTGIAYFTVAGPTTARTYTFPDASSTMATLAGAESLTNKKLGSLTTNGFVKTSGLDGTLSVDTATYLTSVTAHNLLSATHGDTLADTVVRGDILYGNSTPKWARLAKPSVLSGLSHDGTDVSWVTANGTGAPARTTNPVFVTPNIGAATGTSLTNSSSALQVTAATSINFTVGGAKNIQFHTGDGYFYLDTIVLDFANGDVFLTRGAAATLRLGLDVNGAAVSQSIQAANGITGTDRTGGNFTVASGKGTGAGAVSSIFLQTPTALVSGTTAQSLTTRVTVDGNGIKATGYLSSDGSAGVTAGPFTTITSITVKNGLVTALTGA